MERTGHTTTMRRTATVTLDPLGLRWNAYIQEAYLTTVPKVPKNPVAVFFFKNGGITESIFNVIVAFFKWRWRSNELTHILNYSMLHYARAVSNITAVYLMRMTHCRWLCCGSLVIILYYYTIIIDDIRRVHYLCFSLCLVEGAHRCMSNS